MSKYRAVRIQVDFADGSKLVSDGEEAAAVWSAIEATVNPSALWGLPPYSGPRLRAILPNGEEVGRS